jgi:hypothetical protein
MQSCIYPQLILGILLACYSFNHNLLWPLLVVPNDLVPQLGTIDPCLELGTHEEGSTQFSVETVRLLWWWRESVGEHNRDKRSNGRSDSLLGELVGALMAEWA